MYQDIIKIKLPKNNSNFFNDLNNKVKAKIDLQMITRAQKIIFIKLIFYVTLYLGSYGMIYSHLIKSNSSLLIMAYCLFGLSGILLAFNASHDAVHNTLFKNRKANWISHYVIFNLQGVNATLWKKRHLHSHHLFPNVDGCDADIDDNPFLRLSKSQQHKRLHKYQHFYAPFVYMLYTLHWILLKDFIYLKKKRVANITNLNYPIKFKIEVIALKLIYLIITIGLPILFTEFSFSQILTAFIIMHFIVSLFFVLTLIISHLTNETAFPLPDKKGNLPFNYYSHQLAVSLDYHPTNNFANWIFGGFNSHAAHHLFPNIQHTLYTQISPLIKTAAYKHNIPYNELSLFQAIKSHFLYLKKLSH